MIRFIYNNGVYSKERENVITNICKLANNVLSLPDYIEVEICKMNDNVYAESIANQRFKNRIRLNDSLLLTEIIKPIIHELIHLEQIYKGKLKTDRQGNFIYENKTYKNINPLNLSHDDYKNLPWEVDVRLKEKQVLTYVLNFGRI
jgi:hypothetical protein